MDKQESSLGKFGSVTHQLLTECHPSVADTLNRALRDVNIRWDGSAAREQRETERSHSSVSRPPSLTHSVSLLVVFTQHTKRLNRLFTDIQPQIQDLNIFLCRNVKSIPTYTTNKSFQIKRPTLAFTTFTAGRVDGDC